MINQGISLKGLNPYTEILDSQKLPEFANLLAMGDRQAYKELFSYKDELKERERKASMVAELVEGLAECFSESVDLILKLLCLSESLIDFISNVEGLDLLKFFKDQDYKEKFLLEYYSNKYPYLSHFKFNNFDLIDASLVNYEGSFLPDLPTSLQNLRFLTCHKLTNLSGIESLKNLHRLVIIISTLTSLDGLEGCENLQSLHLYTCRELTSLSGIEKLKNLQSLEVYYCESLKSLSGIEACKNLRMLKIDSITLKKLDLESKEILKGLEENPDVEVVYS